jgi:hypothetical protein
MQDEDTAQRLILVLWKGVIRVQIFGYNLKTSKFYSERNLEQTEVIIAIIAIIRCRICCLPGCYPEI